MFHVGQKVVCVDDESHNRYTPKGYVVVNCGLHGLTKGRIYTVRRIGEYMPGVVCVWLEEILRPIEPKSVAMVYGECGYDPRRFRPVVEKKTDISIFTAMLNPSRIKENA